MDLKQKAKQVLDETDDQIRLPNPKKKFRSSIVIKALKEVAAEAEKRGKVEAYRHVSQWHYEHSELLKRLGLSSPDLEGRYWAHLSSSQMWKDKAAALAGDEK